jgi:hypothetical protein
VNQDSLQGEILGRVVSGSLTQGVRVKLEGGASVEDMAVGRYVTIEGGQRRFFGLITDISLESIDPQLSVTPPDVSDPFIAEVVAGTGTYGGLNILLTLTLGGDAMSLLEGPQPAKTVPAHFSWVRQASQEDIELVFGAEDEKHFVIGNPLDMETKVCLNLEEMIKRSNGVFGKTGTGKTFLARILLIGMLQKRDAVHLVFDMHSEYGWSGKRDERGVVPKGLKQLFPSRVAVFTLDEESSRRRNVQIDWVVQIGYDEIEPQDIEMLRETLNLTDLAAQASHRLARHFGEKKWLESFLALEGRQEIAELAQALGEHEGTLGSLHRGLRTLSRLRFLVPRAADNSVMRILEYLERGTSVVLEFGRYTDIVGYILVANLLTRRLHARYQELTEKALGEDLAPPRPLVITIEEAHRFLSPELSGQTAFGSIAREMRKYNVTLQVIDQRPSGIDEEVMSQLGTRLICLLDNERDIDSVLAGVSGRSELRAVLARLESKQQALILGHAVPMPLVIRTREYGSPESYKALGFQEAAELKKKAEEDLDLWR